MSAPQRLVLVGGGKRSAEVTERLLQWAGSQRAEILLIGWASRKPAAKCLAMKAELARYHRASITLAPYFAEMHTSRGKAVFHRQLAKATSVFFTGGSQQRIMAVLDADPALRSALRARYRDGVVFSGTSAGTAIMSPIMITGEGDFTSLDVTQSKTRDGLGLLPDVILDQHFLRRRRQNRLFAQVLHHRNLLGIGIDEDAAIAVEANRYLEVLGAGTITLVARDQDAKRLTLELLDRGDRYDLVKRVRLNATPSPPSAEARR